ncbi:uncharacterized protein J8A68_005015 [[Candida] subhashii]|uniref:Uncharacterized protein n=1 Tax=[Candida] subhashii TaxID=561895 RepID=A0A8J5QDR6_9ASCO|nr:uncharacterized protein J8A68_005015 [[Candida] subhashii]KAG7661437.1 hypothetical protein J8A68_005015 [[Candida] subhashii]
MTDSVRLEPYLSQTRLASSTVNESTDSVSIHSLQSMKEAFLTPSTSVARSIIDPSPITQSTSVARSIIDPSPITPSTSVARSIIDPSPITQLQPPPPTAEPCEVSLPSPDSSLRSALIRLEVHTASSESSSLPEISADSNTNGTPSLETLSLFEHSEDGQPRYPNTSRMRLPKKRTSQQQQQQQPQPQRQPTASYYTQPFQRSGPVRSSQDTYNQVPKRFSQFVIDQKNPFLATRLDNLSFISPSVSNEYRVIKKHTADTTTRGLGDNHKTSLGPIDDASTRLRDISDSMGSQATIFSTRQTPDSEVISLMKSKSKRTRKPFLFRRTKTQRTSNVKLYRVASANSSLIRRNAIKFKQGSWLYRLKLRLKKMFQKMKFYNFKVSSKRHNILRRKSKKEESKVPHISNPITNPLLGKQPVFKVVSLDDAKPFQPGSKPSDLHNEKIGKHQHLSEYINEQEHSYFHTLVSKRDSIRVPQSVNKYPAVNTSKINEMSDDDDDDDDDDALESEAPLPPPHFDTSYFEDPKSNYNKYSAQELWKSYLLQVLCKRIQLRQEISTFQQFLASKSDDLAIMSPESTDTNRPPTISSSLCDTPMRLLRARESMIGDSGLGSSCIRTTTERSKDDNVSLSSMCTMSTDSSIPSDPNDKEFAAKVLQRRSMLGDMLEYLSDDNMEEDEEEEIGEDGSVFVGGGGGVGSYASRTNSILSSSMQSDILSKTYGTISRSGTTRRVPTIRRSYGIAHSLSQLSINEISSNDIQL